MSEEKDLVINSTRVDYVPDYEFLFEDEEMKDGKKGGIKLLKKLYGMYWKNMVVSTILFLIKHSPLWIIPIITSNIINIVSSGDIGSSKSQKDILINIAVLLGLLALNIPTHVLYSRYVDKTLRTIGAGLRNTLIKKLQHLSITYHNITENGKIQAKFLRDIEAIEFLNTHLIKSVIPSLISVFVAVGISIKESGLVTLFFLFVIPVNVILIYFFRRKMRKNNREYRTVNESMSAKVTTMLDMIQITKAHGLEEQEIAAIEQNISSVKEKGLNLDKTNSYFASTSWVIGQALSAVCLLFTSSLAVKGLIAVGSIVMFQSYFSSISMNVQNLVNIFPEMTKGLESVKSVSEIMLSDDIEDDRDKIPLRYVHGTIYFDKVSYHYPDAEVNTINNFNLHVEPGECVAFVGASGSGKTTIMNMIIGFLKATEGQIKVDGKPIEMLKMGSYRKFLAVVPQNTAIFMGTLRDNIVYGMHNVNEERLQEVIKMACIDEFLDELPNGLDTEVGDRGSKLSGGQKQRISIARALIRDPRILILDEATSALDNISEYHVQRAINRLIKGRTTFIVAHRLSTIRDADRIVVMENGSCVESGTYDELMAKKGKFYELKNLSDMTVHPEEVM
ncbi:MAG: ABC transporter ATP-binding protein [Eubacteriales bacterium]|nr:ABC transporter ATP-binding protein [Eubacteriales bacterium]